MPASPPERPRLRRSPHQGQGPEFVSGIERGMVFWARLASHEAQGAEHHEGEPSAWVVLSSAKLHARLPLVQVAPLTANVNEPRLPLRILIPASKRLDYAPSSGEAPLDGERLVLTEQLRVFAHARLLGNPVAKLTQTALFEIEAAVKDLLELA